jgi:hypothetical protein
MTCRMHAVRLNHFFCFLFFLPRHRALRNLLTSARQRERAALDWTYVSSVELGVKTQGLDVIGRLASALCIAPFELFRLSVNVGARRRTQLE